MPCTMFSQLLPSSSEKSMSHISKFQLASSDNQHVQLKSPILHHKSVNSNTCVTYKCLLGVGSFIGIQTIQKNFLSLWATSLKQTDTTVIFFHQIPLQRCRKIYFTDQTKGVSQPRTILCPNLVYTYV